METKPTLNSDSEQLAARADRVRTLVRRQARRAFVVEFAGTPKAGKSTSVAVIKQFFEQCGFRVHLLKERAADCPLPMKGHFFFNTWTMCSMLAEVLATVDTETDLLILDRGVFDALMWLELQHRRGQVTDDEKAIFASFVTLERWRRLIDLTFVVTVDPEVAMLRENSARIIPKLGSLMNPGALAEINDVLSAVAAEHVKSFTLKDFNTSSGDVIASNKQLTALLLDAFEAFADPEILAVPRSVLETVGLQSSNDDASLLGDADALRALDAIVEAVVSRKRSSLEEDDEFVQLVGCGLPHDQSSRLFLLKRTEKDAKSGQYGRYTLWKGCHLECGAELPLHVDALLDAAASQLVRRISEDFHLAIPLRPSFRAITWKRTEKHAGLLFEVPIDSAEAVRHMGQKEFKRQGRFEPHKGDLFKTRDDLLRTDGIEAWSRSYLEWTKAS